MNKNLPIQLNGALSSAVVSFSHTHTKYIHTLGARILWLKAPNQLMPGLITIKLTSTVDP